MFIVFALFASTRLLKGRIVSRNGESSMNRRPPGYDEDDYPAPNTVELDV
jgi:hypothetical protein